MVTAENAAQLSHQELVALFLAGQEQNATLKQHNATLEQRTAELEQLTQELEQQLEWFKRQLFGQKSERRILESASEQLELGSVLETAEQAPPPTTTVKTFERKQRTCPTVVGVEESRLKFDESVPVERIEVEDPLTKDLDEDEYEVISEEKTHRLAQRPGSYVVLEYVRKTIKVKETKALAKTPVPSAIIERSFADVSFLAGMVVDKFAYHLPLYRQHQRLKASGITLDRGTLTKLTHRVAELLTPIYLSILSSIQSGKVITMDETPVKAGRSKGKMKQCYFWPMYGEEDELVFLFSPTRARDIVVKVLKEFNGTLVTDGYREYELYVKSRSGITHAQCWAHTRRKFVAAEKYYPNECKEVLDTIAELYRIERDIASAPEHEVKQVRESRSAPLAQSLFKSIRNLAGAHSLLPSSPLSKAVNYMAQREVELSVFLHDPLVPIDTNHIERQIRPIALGRKNWLFCSTELGARAVGVLQSLIASCKVQDIDPYTYLVDVLQRVDSHPMREVHLLTPRLWKKHFEHQPMRSDLTQ